MPSWRSPRRSRERERCAHSRRSSAPRSCAGPPTPRSRAVDELARTIALEVGKPLAEARGEAARIPPLLRTSAAEGARMHGETVPVDSAANGAGKLAFTIRQPCGVVVAISPFNYPALLVSAQGRARACGGQRGRAQARAPDAADGALPHAHAARGGATGERDPVPDRARAPSSGRVLCSDPRVRKISFTGSTAVGEEITRVAGVKRLSLELGANCPLIVLPDADLELVAAATATGGFVNAGQVCISVQRVLVAREVYGEFVERLTPLVEGLRTGHPLDEQTGLGPVISEAEAMRVERTIREAVAAGATLVTGGERDGAVVAPSIARRRRPVARDLPRASCSGRRSR